MAAVGPVPRRQPQAARWRIQAACVPGAEESVVRAYCTIPPPSLSRKTLARFHREIEPRFLPGTDVTWPPSCYSSIKDVCNGHHSYLHRRAQRTTGVWRISIGNRGSLSAGCFCRSLALPHRCPPFLPRLLVWQPFLHGGAAHGHPG